MENIFIEPHYNFESKLIYRATLYSEWEIIFLSHIKWKIYLLSLIVILSGKFNFFIEPHYNSEWKIFLLSHIIIHSGKYFFEPHHNFEWKINLLTQFIIKLSKNEFLSGYSSKS